MPCSTASFTTPTGSSYRATACENSGPPTSLLDRNSLLRDLLPDPWQRHRPVRLQIGTLKRQRVWIASRTAWAPALSEMSAVVRLTMSRRPSVSTAI